MEMQQGSEVTDDGFGVRVEEVGRQVVCDDDNILQERNHADDPDVPVWVSCDLRPDVTHIKATTSQPKSLEVPVYNIQKLQRILVCMF